MEHCAIVINNDLKGIAPDEIQVIPYGRTETPKGVFILDDAGAQGIINAFMQQKNDIVIDYEHQTLAGTEAPAAGWIKSLINKGSEGIWAVVEWTQRARQYLANKEYKYVSPVFLKQLSDNRVIKLINVALTNQPNIDGMVPLFNKYLPIEGSNIHKEENTMKELLKVLGLADNAAETQAIAVVNKLIADKAALEGKTAVIASKGVLDALGLAEGATESEITGTIMAMKASHTGMADLVTQVNTLMVKLAERDASDAVEAAVNSGKITPAQKDWATDYAKRDLAGFQVFVSKAPVVVHLEKVTTDKKGTPGMIDGVPPTKEQIEAVWNKDGALRAEFGNNIEAYKAYVEAEAEGLVKIYSKGGN